MIFLNYFTFPDEDTEMDFIWGIKRKCYNTFYPFKVLSAKAFERIDFHDVTILSGGNGCGKTTALNIIAEKLCLARDSAYNKSDFFQDYIDLCSINFPRPIPPGSRIITSDDVFDYMLDVRSLNEGIDQKREERFQEYLDAKYANFQLSSIADYERLKQVNSARRITQSQHTRNTLMGNVREYSNGENAYRYFTEKIEEDGLYLLDETENSLSPKRQLELKAFIEESVRFFGCQFIISTHSPFLLSLNKAKIYDLDETPVTIRKWTEIETVRLHRQFFLDHEPQF